MSEIKFEEKIDVINDLLKKRRHKWMLSSLSYINYEDICQIIRVHFYKKWHLWDQKRPFNNWANTLISNQIRNEIRNNYGNLAPPCSQCQHNNGADLCSFTPSGSKCSECPVYRKWEKVKKAGYSMKLANSLNSEDFIEMKDFSNGSDQSVDIERSCDKLNEILKNQLGEDSYQTYHDVFLSQMTKDQIKEKYPSLNSSLFKKNILSEINSIMESNDLFYEE